MKLKIRKQDLLKALSEAQKKAEAEYKENLVEYRKAQATYRDDVADALEKLAKEIRAGKRKPNSYRDRYNVSDALPPPPQKPVKPGHRHSIRIQHLKASSQDEILISEEDYAAYLAGR